MTNKEKVLDFYGKREVGNTARKLNISYQRIYGWSDELTRQERDGIIACAYRKGLEIPAWLLEDDE